MLKRFLFFFGILTMLLSANVVTPAFADDLSEGLQLYRAKKYQEAIPFLERAANDGHEKAIEALDQIYAKHAKASGLPAKSQNKKDTVSDNTVPNAINDNSSATADSEEKAKSNFLRKVIAIAIAVGLIAGWIIHRKFLRKRKTQQQDKKTPM